MKRLLISVGAIAVAFGINAASAADMPRPVTKAAPAMVTAPLFNWTGCYAGVHAGGGWGKKHWSSEDLGDHGSHKVNGWLGGAQIGCDYQTGPWVFGVEGDYSWARLKGDSADSGFAGNFIHTKVEWLATATVRAGHVFGPALLYLEGGGAWVGDRHAIGSPGIFSRASETRSGWTVGAGAEYAFAPGWSAKIEYNYIDFGSELIQFSCVVCLADQRDIDQHIHVVKVGLNYRFATGGKAPVAAPAVVTKY
ncbi:MAG TPA: outer membrane protein [Xanthobacteraceae bacterium]|nr:outer membrane protein [Xanthobacteraceae bacterium]